MRVDQAHSEAREASKGSVNCTLTQDFAQDAVCGVGGNGPDHVGGVCTRQTAHRWSPTTLWWEVVAGWIKCSSGAVRH